VTILKKLPMTLHPLQMGLRLHFTSHKRQPRFLGHIIYSALDGERNVETDPLDRTIDECTISILNSKLYTLSVTYSDIKRK